MAAGRIVVASRMPARDLNGTPISGALLTLYVNNTTTLTTIYANEALTVPLTNPVAADSNGNWPQMWAESGTEETPTLYSVALSDGSGVPLSQPSVFDDFRPSVDYDTATAAIAESAADAAQQYYDDIIALGEAATPEIAIASRAAKAANLSDLASASAARTNLDLPAAVFTDATSGNYFYGTNPSLLTNSAAGVKNGDINTGFGLNTMPNATTAYACTALGYSSLFSLTTGHSNTALGYQAGLALTTGIMNTLTGVDAGFVGSAFNYTTVYGHHCLNLGAFAGEGAVIIGQQTARNLTTGDYINVIGRNAMANCPATGSANCEVIGGAAAIAASVNGSTIIGKDAVAITAAISDSVIIGKSAQYGGGTISANAIGGVETFFRASGGGGNNNTSWGYQTGYSIAGTGNTLIGYRAGYMSSNTTVNSAICIGNLAGFNQVASGDLFIGNSDSLAAHVLWGNFGTQTFNLRANQLTLVDLPTFATDTAASGAGYGTGLTFADDSGFVRRVRASPTADTFSAAISFGSTFRSMGYTVATLPAAGTAGRRAHVTDATAPTYLGALTGGGAVTCPVFDNGSAWVSA